MSDREKVIKGFELCLKTIEEPDCRKECLYYEACQKYDGRVIFQPLMRDALALLKEQEARVMALDELTEIYVEFKGDNCPIRLTNFDLQKIVKYAVDGDCRLWAGKPTDEQRQAVKWE